MLIGNLTRDPELRATPSGQSVVSFGVATNRRWTDQSGERKEEAEFHEVVAWGKLAEICNQILSKGRKVYIEGRLHTRSWEAPDGTKKFRTEIIASDMRALDSRLKEEIGELEEAQPPVEEIIEEQAEEPSKKDSGKKASQEEQSKKGKSRGTESAEEDDIEEINIEDIPF